MDVFLETGRFQLLSCPFMSDEPGNAQFLQDCYDAIVANPEE